MGPDTRYGAGYIHMSLYFVYNLMYFVGFPIISLLWGEGNWEQAQLSNIRIADNFCVIYESALFVSSSSHIPSKKYDECLKNTKHNDHIFNLLVPDTCFVNPK